jgi:hypothetical protein
VLHFFFFGKNSPNCGEAKGAEKQQQRDNAEPLNALYGLKQVFVHFFCFLMAGGVDKDG